jgi:tight adherence protein B
MSMLANMSFEFGPTTVIYIFAATSAILFVEAIYIWCFSTASYRGTINRRLNLLSDQPDRESVLIQLRRERGLTSGGLYGLPILSLNRLILQSGVTIGVGRLGLVVGIGVLLALVVQLWFGSGVIQSVLITLAGAVALPFAILRWLRKRRQAKFGERFPDAVDIIVRSLRAGHPIPVAISMVARELPDPLGTEFGMVVDEITYGADLETAMRNLSFRVGQQDLPLFVTAVAIQSSTGGNLSEILSNLSAVIRQRFKMRRKIRALAAEARFSALFLSGLPVVIFFLLQTTSPQFYSSVWDQDLTKIGLSTAAAWMMFGNILMYRMVNFRI